MCRVKFVVTYVILALVATAWPVGAVDAFDGFERTDLEPVPADDWGLKIVVFDVGQADAIVLLTPNGDVALVDSGRRSGGVHIGDFLSSSERNGLGELGEVKLVYSTHYDADHIWGLPGVVERGIQILKAFDQGVADRPLTTPTDRLSAYGEYVTAVGDPNNNGAQDDDEPGFVRHRMEHGHVEHIGEDDAVEIRCVSVRGDTEGADHDIPNLDPMVAHDENPGSIALVIRLGEFEFYTAGDQTDDDWRGEPAVEDSILDADAIPGGPDIDVLKVSHHGSDTSSSPRFIQALDPEVAIISSKFTARDRIPKRITLKQLQDNRCYVMITGDAHNPDVDYPHSPETTDDDSGAFHVDPAAVLNQQGNVTVLVSPDGTKYTVKAESSFTGTFSAVDADNER